MSEAYAIHAERTVPAFPLGQPEDGRPRYGMTPEQAASYRWLVKYKPHDGEFGINFRETAWRMARHYGVFHETVRTLVDRGWLEVAEHKHGGTTYRFVPPVMHFKAARHG